MLAIPLKNRQLANIFVSSQHNYLHSRKNFPTMDVREHTQHLSFTTPNKKTIHLSRLQSRPRCEFPQPFYASLIPLLLIFVHYVFTLAASKARQSQTSDCPLVSQTHAPLCQSLVSLYGYTHLRADYTSPFCANMTSPTKPYIHNT